MMYNMDMKKLVAMALTLLLLVTGCSYRWSSYYMVNGQQVPYTWVCGPIYYQINAWNTNGTQINEIHAAMQDLGYTMGRAIYFAGFTNETLRGNGPANGKILIEHYWPSDAPSGYGWTRRTVSGTRYVGANIYLNAPSVIHSHVVRHEAGHAVGLDHVSDPQEIMDPTYIWQNSTWGPGTTGALNVLGHQGC